MRAPAIVRETKPGTKPHGAPAFFREAGAGPGVVCLHANASTSSQWRALMDVLAPRFHVLAPDLYDAGDSPHWPSPRVIALDDEVALIEPLFARADAPVSLVGHSYGAAVALVAAVAHPDRVRALVLYEPTLFALLFADHTTSDDAKGIRDVVEDATTALDAGDGDAAAERFIDYWMGKGSWQQTPASRRQPIAESVRNVRRWAHALFTEPLTVAALRSLDIPVLLMTGARSTDSARAVSRVLAGALPRLEFVEFEHLGHMGPVTHPDDVNRTIEQFLLRVP